MTDDEHDIDIERLIRAGANDHFNRAKITLLQTRYQLDLDQFPYWGQRIILPYPPLLSIQSFTYYDTDNQQQTMVEGTDYQVRNHEVVPMADSCFWPTAKWGRVDAVSIQYDAGYADQESVPDLAKQFILAWTRYQYDNADGHLTKEVDEGLAALAIGAWCGSYPDPQTSPY